MPRLAAKSLLIRAVTFPSETCIRLEEWPVTAPRLPSKRGAGRYRLSRGFHGAATAQRLQRSAASIPTYVDRLLVAPSPSRRRRGVACRDRTRFRLPLERISLVLPALARDRCPG